MSKPNILIADIGGTNARFAIAGDELGAFDSAQTLMCADFEFLEQAVDSYLKQNNLSDLDAICFAAAGPVQNQKMKFTNNHWLVNMPELAARYAVKSSRLLNDFEAISYSLPALGYEKLSPIGGRWELPTKADQSLGVLGPGSGLGVGGLIVRNYDEYIPLVTEGGHAGFSPESPYQLELMKALFINHPRISNERLLSGPGLVNIYQAVCRVDGIESKHLTISDVGKLAVEESDQQCVMALKLFFEFLGQVAGNVALTQAAFDGIYIAGGIAMRYPQQLANSHFRAGFERKGRNSFLLEATPTWLITEPNPGLMGASIYAQKYL